PDINFPDQIGRTALHIAAAYGYPTILSTLIQYAHDDGDALMQSVDYDNRTALHIACLYNRDECVNVLIEHTVDVNIQDSEGNTPLHYAIKNRNYRLAERLVNAGAKLIENYSGNKPDDLLPKHSLKNRNRQISLIFSDIKSDVEKTY